LPDTAPNWGWMDSEISPCNSRP